MCGTVTTQSSLCYIIYCFLVTIKPFFVYVSTALTVYMINKHPEENGCDYDLFFTLSNALMHGMKKMMESSPRIEITALGWNISEPLIKPVRKFVDPAEWGNIDQEMVIYKSFLQWLTLHIHNIM